MLCRKDTDSEILEKYHTSNRQTMIRVKERTRGFGNPVVILFLRISELIEKTFPSFSNEETEFLKSTQQINSIAGIWFQDSLFE